MAVHVLCKCSKHIATISYSAKIVIQIFDFLNILHPFGYTLIFCIFGTYMSSGMNSKKSPPTNVDGGSLPSGYPETDKHQIRTFYPAIMLRLRRIPML